MSDIKQKYIEMASARNTYNDIDIENFLLPTMGEMVDADLMEELFQQYASDDESLDINSDSALNANKEALNRAFYTETPFSIIPGYYKDQGAFIVRASRNSAGIDSMKETLNVFDGDTTAFPLYALEDGAEEFSFYNGDKAVKYNGFKDYFKKIGGGSELSIRYLGMDTAEIPHFGIQPIRETEKKNLVLEISFKEFKDNYLSSTKYSIVYEKYPVSSDKTAVIERKDTDTIKLLKVKEENRRTYLVEIIDRINIKNDWISNPQPGYTYHAIINQEESASNLILDGYKAQKLVKEKLNQAQDIILMLNANGVSVDKTSIVYNKTFDSLFYMPEITSYLLEQWDSHYSDLGQSNHGYQPYGTDTYGRSLGVIYVKDNNGEWLNLNKYILANTEFTISNPQFNDSPELQAIGSGVSDSFNLWSYDKDNIDWVDSFNNISEQSYNERIELHKKYTGIDFLKIRDCSLLIGDTLFMIPPENIRSLSQNYYERLPNMRSKGTMAKSMGNSENLLEINLFFYEEQGINGIAYQHITPSGEVKCYRLDGLNGLIAQFKVAPFLPIENGYINDVLGIEAVALKNMAIQTVEGFPRLLKVVLTLQEFNYRIYMPDMPVDDNMEESDDTRLSQLQPMFAKSFNWDIFRYYYQRSLEAGEDLDAYEFASYDYNLFYYSHKNTVGKWKFCGPQSNSGEVSFYVPNEDWLSNALQLKKQRDSVTSLTTITAVDLSENAKAFCKELSKIANSVAKLKDYESVEGKKFREAINNIFDNHNKGNTIQASVPLTVSSSGDTVNNIHGSGVPKFKIKNISTESLRNEYISPLVAAFENLIKESSIVNYVGLDETLARNALSNTIEIAWRFKIKLNINSISSEDWTNIREVLSKELDDIKIVDIFADEIISIDYKILFNALGHVGTTDIIKTSDFITKTDGYRFTFSANTSSDESVLSALKTLDFDDTSEAEDTTANAHNTEIEFYIRDYKNPANMPFEPYIENVLCKTMGANISNSFTEMHLKAIEGRAPQYLGGQDTQIELEMLTDDIAIVGAINTLPTLASAMAKKYRRILPAWPIKIKSDLTNLLGISEVLIDTLEIDTVDGFPGVYSIVMRLTSVDRTQRQREALRRLDVDPQGGKIDYNGNSELSMRNYFSIDNALAEADLYPDLDLPTLEEFGKLGYRFVKYAGKIRSYPDPDFYISYAYPYTSLIIKKLVKDGLAENLLNVEGEDQFHSFKFKDVMGAEMTAKIEAYLGLNVTSLDSDEALEYSDILNNLQEQIAEKLVNENKYTKKEIENIQDKIGLGLAIKKIMMSDVTNGWEIRPGWRAPLSEPYTETLVNKLVLENEENAYAQEILDIRKEAVALIDAILSKPIEIRSYDGHNMETAGDWSSTSDVEYRHACQNAINEIFINNEDGKALINLLCPGSNIKKALSFSSAFTKTYFNQALPLNYMAGFTFAAGCALSGQKEYVDPGIIKTSKYAEWYPNHYIDYSVKEKCVDTTDEYKGYFMPYVSVNRLDSGVQVTKSIEEGVQNGVIFGGWRINKVSSINDIVNMVESENRNIFFGENENNSVFKHTIRPGFIDPYYNAYDSNSDTLKNYKKTILLNKQSNVEAFIRNALVYLRKMIIDGLLISEIDIIARDFEELCFEVQKYTDTDNNYDNDAIVDRTEWVDTLKELGYDTEELDELLDSAKESIQKAFCSRLIYPFLLAATNGNQALYNLMKDRNYDAFESYTGYVEDTSSAEESNVLILKYLTAMSGMKMSLADDSRNESVASESQMLMNSIMKDIFIQASTDPRAYVLHSFYDMLINDKRGRLVRAFPTYYAMFIDEGRKIGSWKLHDNFYNMNSIASINIVKSRKIAADTCTIVMNNMFGSYAQEPDITTTQQYTDIYGMRDVFDSIFSPKTYFNKEKKIRLRQQLTETVVLQPGVRIHVRMGYGSDGSKLPIVFNGKVAEASVEEVCQIVAQGDGHELTNPLNSFGQMDVTELDPMQSSCTWFKDFRGNWASGGKSPRDLLANILTARYGGWRKNVNYAFDGRWFNDSPFGITHFGDLKFDNIFEQGEAIQNLYEVCDNTTLKDVNLLIQDTTEKKSTPTINTSIEDKTFWDLLHLCANAGTNYIGAIADFGFRSTVFLGKPNQYYAYGYQMVGNKIVERRKPFQQFHYYDSYTDIIYNSIKASEAQMKTNAVGTWESTAFLWGTKQSTVGPIYLDMNIYPEYQKSMTVDTQLVAAGNGGIDLNPTNWIAENFKLDINDDRVNKTTAERITANVLKNSIKDMYLGDMCVMGDPSIKPYDRVYLHDTYEDMKGMFEVEAVIHNMSIDTGFTTSIMPDVIVRHGDEFEAAVQSITTSACATMAMTQSVLILDKLWGGAVHNKLTTVMAKSGTLWKDTKLATLATGLSNTPGLKDFLDTRPGAKSFLSSFNIFSAADNLAINQIDNAIDVLSNLDFAKSANLWDDLGKALVSYSLIDDKAYIEAIDSILKKDKYGITKTSGSAINTFKGDITFLKASLDSGFDVSKLNLSQFADDILKVTVDNDLLTKKLSSSTIETLTKWKSGTALTSTSDTLKDLGKVLNEEAILKAIKNNDLKVTSIDDFCNGFRKILSSNGSNVSKFKMMATALKGENILDMLKTIGKGALKFNWVTLLIDLAIDLTITFFVKDTQQMITRFLQNIQAIDVYPLKRYNKPLIAGMNGHKGSVYGWPVADGYNSIQGMILEFADKIDTATGGKSKYFKWFSTLIKGLFVDLGVLDKLSQEWRISLGIDEASTLNKEEMYQEIYSSISSMYASMNDYAYAIMTRPRISVTDKSSTALELYNFYKITGINLNSSASITNNLNLLNLYYVLFDTDLQQATINGKFVVSHSQNPTYSLTIPFESGLQNVPVSIKDGVMDMPLVHEEIIYILKYLINDEQIKENNIKIYFKSGVRVNDSNGWNSTGFRAKIEVKGSMEVMEAVLKTVKSNTSIIKNSVGVFEYQIQDSTVELKVNPPIQTVVEGV